MAKKILRRELLIAAGVGAASVGVLAQSRTALSFLSDKFASLTLPEHGFILGEGQNEYGRDQTKKDSRRVPVPGNVMLLNPHGAIVKSWPIPFYPHGIQQSPVNPNLIVAVQKTGEHFAVIDPREKMPIKIVRSKTEMNYFGHGVFTADGNILGVTAMDPDTRLGYVILFETKNFEPIAMHPLNGSRPHELQLDTENPNCFIVATGGGLYNSHYKKNIERRVASQENPDIAKLVWLNWKTGLIEKSVLSRSTDETVPGHFTQIEPGKILTYGLTTKTMYGSPSFALVNRTEDIFHSYSNDWPSEYAGECLNVFSDAANKRLWLALPDSNRLLVLDAQTFKVLQEIGIKEPRSITHLAPDIIGVSSSPNGTLIQIGYSLSKMQIVDLEEARRIGGREIVLASTFSSHSTRFRRG